ncbi:hypothetical protein A1O3_08931 [Capronia epimyces CBS 606.96]|uniref:HpcH/HpaI aldolase/citrate lyase domain-containing protein n=1 Tax=Capronia epimyces CBS 606.96 TaxID=1182542 RepID=W9YAN8_9EURO|nr:uncharacterized protein A1O3_08931 [Capronia epimyces CBS 606.96]EXJ79429.1 hypothetical protein A1O3_08931 [Capronia epimyces CBS 606.96]
MPSFRELLLSQPYLLGTFVSFNDPYSAQILARCGFDWLMVDMEHSPLSPAEMTAMAHSTVAASGGNCSPIIRVPSHGVEWIKWALDSGAGGIIIPMVNSKKEVEAIVQRALYPPAGQRSYGPFRAPFADRRVTATMADYKEHTSSQVMVLPMIESTEGVANAEDIMRADGVDGVFIGPVDLRHSLGLSGPDGNEPAYLAALQRVLELGRRYGKPVGILGSPNWTARLVKMGFKFVMLAGGDAGILAEAASALLTSSRESIQLQA